MTILSPRIPAGGSSCALPLEADEKIFGLGLQFMKVNHRGRTRYLRVNSDPVQDTGETHAPVPFYVSSRGYGILVNTAGIPTICCGSTVRLDAKRRPAIRDRVTDPDWQATPDSDLLEIVVEAPGLELYAFAGPDMLDVVRRFNLFCGGGTLPPRWGLGFWHRVHYQWNAQQCLDEVQEARRRGYPLDVLGLEPGWQTCAYPTSYEWSPERFPQPAEFIRKLAAESIRVNLWENPYVAPRRGCTKNSSRFRARTPPGAGWCPTSTCRRPARSSRSSTTAITSPSACRATSSTNATAAS